MSNIKTTHEVLIDPLALLLPTATYVAIHGPRPITDAAEIKTIVSKLSSADRTAVLKNARAQVAFLQNVIEATAGMK